MFTPTAPNTFEQQVSAAIDIILNAQDCSTQAVKYPMHSATRNSWLERAAQYNRDFMAFRPKVRREAYKRTEEARKWIIDNGGRAEPEVAYASGDDNLNGEDTPHFERGKRVTILNLRSFAGEIGTIVGNGKRFADTYRVILDSDPEGEFVVHANNLSLVEDAASGADGSDGMGGMDVSLSPFIRRCLRPLRREQPAPAFDGALVYFPPRGQAIAAWLIDFDAADEMVRISYDFTADDGRTLTSREWVSLEDVMPRGEWNELVYAS